MLRFRLRRLYKRLMVSSASEIRDGGLERSAIVFSPHQDDETLGCGGTIIKKKRAGADVRIVFMTDGRNSHSRLTSPNELKAIRAREALAASRMLGLHENDVIFLAFEDKKLGEHWDAALERVTKILLRYSPDEVFIPYHREAPPDHVATNRIVLSALQVCRRQVVIYEYPIWYWHQWPWTSVSGSRPEILATLRNSLNSGLGLRVLRDFGCSVYIGDVLDLKRTALDQHESQMTRLSADLPWPTLGDVSGGEFLACFFEDFEVFRCYSLSA